MPDLFLPPAAPEPIILKDLFWPWVEMKAQNVPPGELTTDLHVQLSLAMLAGMANGLPRLVAINDDGTISTKLTVASQAAPASVVSIDRIVAPGATQVLLVAAAGSQFFVFDGWLELEAPIAANTWDLVENATGKVLATFNTDVAGGRPLHWNGIGLTVDNGLLVRNHGAANIAIRGWLTVTLV